MDTLGTAIAEVPLGLTFVGLLLLFVTMVWLGHGAHARFGKEGDAGETSDETEVLGAAMMLLALLMGFTFAMALSRYDNRRELVVQEANDIGTAWLRAGLVENPAGKALQDRLAAYARTRIGSPDEGSRDRLAAGKAMRDDIWTLTATAVRPERSTAQSASLVAAVNAVLDTATERERAINAHLPGTVVALLVVYSAVAAFLLGYVMAAFRTRHVIASTTLMVLLSTTISLILDLDRPQQGAVRVSQQAMIDLVADLERGQ